MQSDKQFWHGYIPFYETFFVGRDITTIAEIGIFQGNSIRWLLERFPGASIDAGDILPMQDSWPINDLVTYYNMDQGNSDQLESFFNKEYDLIIEDGSHYPEHQLLSLLVGLPKVNSNGIYIVEDIHTSLNGANALSTLLGIDHYRRIGQPVNLDAIAQGTTIDAETVSALDALIDSISIYKRTHLPNRCYNCGSTDYDYKSYRCICGTEIYKHQDSMSCVIIRK